MWRQLIFVALYSVMSLPDFHAMHLYFVVIWQEESKRGQQMAKAVVRDDHSSGQIWPPTAVVKDDHNSDNHSRRWGWIQQWWIEHLVRDYSDHNSGQRWPQQWWKMIIAVHEITTAVSRDDHSNGQKWPQQLTSTDHTRDDPMCCGHSSGQQVADQCGCWLIR